MTYYEEVPVGDYGLGYDPEGIDEQEWLQETFTSIIRFDFDRRHFHNRDGWFADEAFSEKCLALGHSEEGGDDPHYADGQHSRGWDGSMLCEGTKWGVACTECESEACPYLEEALSIWDAPGVAA